MELKLRTNTKLSYISEYIKTKFPMYFDAMNNNNASFMGLVNSIHFIPEIKSITLEELKDGSKDDIIDRYVVQYVKNNMTDVYERFNNVCVYIYNLIKEEKEYNDSISFLNDVSNQIGSDCFNQIDMSLVRTGKYDEIFYNKYLEIRKQVKNQFSSYIRDVIDSMDEKDGFSNDTMNMIISDIADDMLKKYDPNKVYDDKNVIEMFSKLSNEIKLKVKEHIKKFLNNMDLVIGVSTDKVINDLLQMALVTGEISAVDLIDGKLDNKIYDYANKNRKHGYDDTEIIEYIYNYLSNIAVKGITDDQLLVFSKEVKEILMVSQYTYNSTDILEHKCDLLIKNLYLEKYSSYSINGRGDWVLEYSKKKKNKKKELLKYEPKKKGIQKFISRLLVISSLLSLGSYAIIKQNRKSNDLELIDVAKSLDSSFSYSINYSSNLSERLDYENACVGVINYYNILKEYGPQYIDLCFYNAYSEGLKLEEMDNLLKMVKNVVSKDENYAELSDILGDDICYLDYIYNSLVRMGCEEIKNEKYLNAVISYKQSYYGNMYGIPSDYHMSIEDKEVIDNLLKLYEEYSRKCQIELGNKIMEQEENTISLSNNGSKRGV